MLHGIQKKDSGKEQEAYNDGLGLSRGLVSRRFGLISRKLGREHMSLLGFLVSASEFIEAV